MPNESQKENLSIPSSGIDNHNIKKVIFNTDLYINKSTHDMNNIVNIPNSSRFQIDNSLNTCDMRAIDPQNIYLKNHIQSDKMIDNKIEFSPINTQLKITKKDIETNNLKKQTNDSFSELSTFKTK